MQPLKGITVVTLEHAIAAPFATRQLADLGARVIKVERPGVGDFARGYDERVRGLASHFVWTNRSKESLTLDVKHEEAQKILMRLIVEAFSSLTAVEVADRLEKSGIANAQVNTMAEVWAHPQLQARDRWREIGTPAGPIPALLPPGSWDLGAPRMDAVPVLGQHTDAILSQQGYSAARIAALRTEGVV